MMNTERLSIREKLHYYHRFWRYWWRTEPDTVRFIKEEFARGGTAFDIGANKGIVTYFLGKQAGPQGKVYAFEPQPEMGDQISRVAKSFGLHNVEIHGIGLSEGDGEATLFCGKPGQTANMVASGSWQNEEIKVPTRSLDSFVDEHNIKKIDFVKCDVDGFESEVLRGATGVMKEFSPKMLVEIGETKLPGISEILQEQGYDGGVFWRSGKRYPASETTSISYRHPNAKWRNFLFRKK